VQTAVPASPITAMVPEQHTRATCKGTTAAHALFMWTNWDGDLCGTRLESTLLCVHMASVEKKKKSATVQKKQFEFLFLEKKKNTSQQFFYYFFFFSGNSICLFCT
jgi:hypothetical protein